MLLIVGQRIRRDENCGFSIFACHVAEKRRENCEPCPASRGKGLQGLQTTTRAVASAPQLRVNKLYKNEENSLTVKLISSY